MEGFLAGIAIGFLLWGLCPFASYFYLGMGNRSDRAKKIFPHTELGTDGKTVELLFKD